METYGQKLARHAHRRAFAGLSLLPRRARRGLFNVWHTVGTGWDYETSEYEKQKREHLLDSIPTDAKMIVEVGTASGHNLLPLAYRALDAQVVGVDVSERAVTIARKAVENEPRVNVVAADVEKLAGDMPSVRGKCDVLVLSEVLYYLGSGRVLTRQLRFLRPILAESPVVVMVHGGKDSRRLHEQSARALGLVVTRTKSYGEGEREYTVAVATLV